MLPAGRPLKAYWSAIQRRLNRPNASLVLRMNPLPEASWNAWSADELHARLGHWGSEWYVVGGRAMDLWHGHQTRAHEDLEFAVPPAGIDGCRKILSELDFFEVREGKLSYFAPNAGPPADLWQLWGADTAAGFWRVDMMVERGTPEVWVCTNVIVRSKCPSGRRSKERTGYSLSRTGQRPALQGKAP